MAQLGSAVAGLNPGDRVFVSGTSSNSGTYAQGSVSIEFALSVLSTGCTYVSDRLT